VSGTAVVTSEVVSTLESDEPLASKLIAVLDDDAAVSDGMAKLLESWGARAVCAPDGDELLRVLSGSRPDLVIADRNLGSGGDGFVVLNVLEAQLGGTLPSVILTGDYDVNDQRQVNNSGRCVLHKPVWPDALLAALCFELNHSAQL
jgi:DNA-binding response OmpR family regulator